MKLNKIVIKCFLLVLLIIGIAAPAVYKANAIPEYEISLDNSLKIEKGNAFDIKLLKNSKEETSEESNLENLDTSQELENEPNSKEEFITIKFSQNITFNIEEFHKLYQSLNYEYNESENILKLDVSEVEKEIMFKLNAIESGEAFIEVEKEEEEINRKDIVIEESIEVDMEALEIDKIEESVEEKIDVLEANKTEESIEGNVDDSKTNETEGSIEENMDNSETNGVEEPIKEESENKNSMLQRSSTVVTTGAQFHAAMINKNITEINIGGSFAITNGLGLFSMNPYRRNLVINGNGYDVDFRNLSYNFDATNSTNYNHVLIRDLRMQGQNYYGPIMMDGAINTGASITYKGTSYEGSQMTSAYIANVFIEGMVGSRSVGNYTSYLDGNGNSTSGTLITTNAANQQNLDVTNITFRENSNYSGYSADSTVFYLRHGGSAVLEKNAKVDLMRSGNAGELAPYVTLYLEGNLTMEENSKLDVATTSGSTAGGIRVQGIGKKIDVKNKAELKVTTRGVNTNPGIGIGDGAILNVASNGLIDVDINSSGASVQSGISVGHSGSLEVKADGKLNVKADGTAPKNLIQMGSSSVFRFSDAERVNLEYSGVPHSPINMPSGKLQVDIQKISSWNKTNTTNTPNFEWNPVYNSNITYIGNNVTNVTSSSITNAMANQFNTNFRSQNFRKILFEKIPNVSITIDPLSNNQSKTNSHTITGLADPGSWIKFAGDTAIPTGTITSPIEGDPTKYHVQADINGKYSYTLPAGSYFTGGNRIESYAFLNGKDSVADTTVAIEESLITIPDENLRRPVNKELGRGYVTQPQEFTKAELESIKVMKYNDSQQNSSGGEKIVSLEGMEHMKNLETITLSKNNISDLSPLSGIMNVEYLELNNNNIVDLSPLSGMKKSKNVYLRNNQISDVSPLSSLTTNLELLELSENNISDISSLDTLVSVRSLSLDSNQIEDITSVASMINLRSFFAPWNKISDISPVTNITSLDSLGLHFNKIKSVEPLRNLLDLQTLYLDVNNIKDVEPLKNLTKMQTLWLGENHILDISPLEAVLKSPNLSYFAAPYQQIDLGIKKVNGTKAHLPNPATTVGSSGAEKPPVPIISDSGEYNDTTKEIEWSGLNLPKQPRSFEFLDTTNTFYGTVNLEIEKVKIMDPNDPDSENLNPDPDGIPNLDISDKLAINYIEPLDFGNNDIGSGNLSIKAKTMNSYVQVSDLRDENTGWALRLTGNKLEHENGLTTIEGASISFKSGDVISSPTGNGDSPFLLENGNNEITVPLDGMSAIEMMNADNQKGVGTWLASWKGTGQTNEKVSLEIPDGKAKAGAYKTSLKWELHDTP